MEVLNHMCSAYSKNLEQLSELGKSVFFFFLSDNCAHYIILYNPLRKAKIYLSSVKCSKFQVQIDTKHSTVK